MPRFARLVVPGYPHHVTQRGSRRQVTFFSESDYDSYIDLLAKNRVAAGVEIWAYCLMPNHVHLILVPRDVDGLSRLLRKTHSTYARQVNAENGWCGHLWQERFHSFVMDEEHLIAAARYIELNPVRANLCQRPMDWQWSSARAHVLREFDRLMPSQPMLDRVDNWTLFLSESNSACMNESIRLHTSNGRPAGAKEFLEELEIRTGRRLSLRKPGPKPSN